MKISSELLDGTESMASVPLFCICNILTTDMIEDIIIVTNLELIIKF